MLLVIHYLPDYQDLTYKLNAARSGVSKPLKSRAYRIFELFMYCMTLIIFASIVVQTLCYKSPLADFIAILLVNYIVHNMIGWDRAKLILNAIVYLIITIAADFVWILVNGRMYDSNYDDLGARRTCRNTTFFTIWIQVLCKVLIIGGLVFRRTNKFTRE